MSTWPAPSALNAATEIFPTLTSAQIDRIRSCGKARSVIPGDVLFKPGDTNVPFFVLLSGELEIVQPGLDGERSITKHSPGSFTGELSMIAGQRVFVLGRVSQAGEFLEISQDGLRQIVAKDAELSEIIMRAFILRRLALITNNLGNAILLGSTHCANTMRLREFLGRNGYPYTFVDLDKDKDSQALLDRFEIKLSDVPVVICDGRTVLRNPSTQKLADCLGLNATIDASQVRDLIIVGAGPSGLAAAVYAASEGLNSLVIETESPGGQELSARALSQAQKFGAKMMVAHSVVRLNCDTRPYRIFLDNGDELKARAIVIASGAQYNKPNIANLHKFESQGVHYGATYIEAQLCEGEEVAVVGGGNSAGQAAVYLSQTARKVHMLVRSSNLSDTMSRYLVQRITDNPKIELHYQTEIVGLEGVRELKNVTWIDKASGETSTHDVCRLFIMTGASPRTDWLQGCVAMDDKGFIITGRDLDGTNGIVPPIPWPLTRAPQMLETSLPGVFAVGDARAGNVKRVASAVGEGAIAIHLVHRTLAEL
jgi:thioredoxin reductase (NADPH)